MARTSQNSNSDKPKHHRTPPNTPRGDAVNNETENQGNTDNTKQTSEVAKNPIEFRIIDDKKWKASDTVATVSVIISLMVGLITAYLGYQSYTANKISKQALHFSDSVSRANDSLRKISDRIQKIAQRKKDSLDSISFQNQKRSVDAQIASLNATEKQFRIENEPYLKIEVAGISELVAGRPVYFEFRIYNEGKQPAQEISAYNTITFIKPADSAKFMKNPYRSLRNIAVNDYITSSNPKKEFFWGKDPLKTKDSADFAAGIKYLFFYGDVIYRSVADNKKRIYKYVFMMTQIESKKVVKGIDNENSDVK